MRDATPARRLLLGLGPLVLLAILLAVFFRFGPAGVFRKAFPPVEDLTIERIALPSVGMIEAHVVNGGPEAVRVSQVLVDDAAWTHEVLGDRTIPRLGRRTIRIPYPWVEGEPVTVTLVTSTGLTFSGEIPVATETPAPDARYLGTFALLGIYAGVIPVFLGLLWLPFLRTLRRETVDFFLALTVGLLFFLGVDALAESLELAGRVPEALQGVGLVAIGVLTAALVLTATGGGKRASGGRPSGYLLATQIALGIGLHNLGEGLAIGGAYSTGEIALGTSLVLGFLLHNTTEGLGIVSPLTGESPSLLRLTLLGLLAGAPTILGTWIGGFGSSPTLSALFLALGAGAIGAVVVQLWRLVSRDPSGRRRLVPRVAVGFVTGMLVMYATGLLVVA
jgi:zinc transporter, ZIP family